MDKNLLGPDEKKRLVSLSAYKILNTKSDEDFDAICKLAAEVCDSPVAYVSFIDAKRQWFKSSYGYDFQTKPREDSICARTILNPADTIEIEDLRLDTKHNLPEEVKHNGFLNSYAGFNILSAEGYAIGTICTMDSKCKLLNSQQRRMMFLLAKQVGQLLETLKNKAIAESKLVELAEKNEELEKFAYIISHDIRSPLNSIFSLTQMLEKKYAPKMDHTGQKTVGYIHTSAFQLKQLVEGILGYYRGEELLNQEAEETNLLIMVGDLFVLLDPVGAIEKNMISLDTTIRINPVALKQILLNLMTNADKYNDKEVCKIEITYDELDTHHQFSVADNGPGVAEEMYDQVFKAFGTLGTKDKYNNAGTGIGMATVKKLVEEMGGQIKLLKSKFGGLRVEFTIKK